MKIAIDCRALRNVPAGIPNFLVTAINEIAGRYPHYQLYLLSNEHFHPDLASKLIYRANIKVIIQPLLVLKRVSFLWLLLKTRAIINKIQPDLYWSPAFLIPPFLPSNLKTLITVHDLVYKEFNSTMSLLGKIYSRILFDYSIRKADKLWANSFYTATAINKYYGNRKSKDIFTGFFINKTIFKPLIIVEEEAKELRIKYNVETRFLLFVGTLEPRKNLEFLLKLIPSIKHLQHKLLVVGAKGWGETKIRNIIEAKGYPFEDVVFAGFVPTDDLIKLYNLASVFISTSLNEGFGMPLLEAMACGCPVVAPHNSAMIEVVVGAGETVKTWAINDWVTALSKVLLNREEYIAKGFKKCEQYEAEQVINQLFSYVS